MAKIVRPRSGPGLIGTVHVREDLAEDPAARPPVDVGLQRDLGLVPQCPSNVLRLGSLLINVVAKKCRQGVKAAVLFRPPGPVALLHPLAGSGAIGERVPSGGVGQAWTVA